MVIFRGANDRSERPAVVAKHPAERFFDVVNENFLFWRGTEVKKQLRAYLVAFELDERRKELRATRDRFTNWLLDEKKVDSAQAKKTGDELEEGLWELQEGGFNWSRLGFSIPLMISIGSVGVLWMIRSDEFANAVGLWGIFCLALGALAALARFSDLFPKSDTDHFRNLLRLSRNDLIGLFGTAGIVATTAASYFKFTHFVYQNAVDNQQIIGVLEAILKKLP